MTDYQRAFWHAFVTRTGPDSGVGLFERPQHPGPNIYRRAVFARRYDALATLFPRICFLLTEPTEPQGSTEPQKVNFDALAFAFINATSLCDPDLANIGVSFASFCAQWGPQNAFPDWLAPLARLEWAAHLLSIQPPANLAQNPLLTPTEALAQRFELAKSARWVMGEYALAEAWLDSSSTPPQKRRCASIVFRVDRKLLGIDLEGEDADLFGQLISKKPLGEIFEDWAGRCSAEDLAGCIAQWKGMGLLRSCP